MSEWWAMKSGELDFNDLVAEYDFDYIFVNGISDSSLYYGLYISPEYTLIYDDYCCSIYMSVEKASKAATGQSQKLMYYYKRYLLQLE
ncbi:MAG: hypothetical protein V8S24_04720 [Gordonibacter pamelaeae]